MAKVFGAELAKEIRATIERVRRTQSERAERIARWETDEDDCFMSIRIDEQILHESDMKLHILEETDGTSEFEVVVDQQGNVVRTHWFENPCRKWTIVGNGVFASSREALLKKTGWHLEKRKYPVWVKCTSSHGGMLGAYLASPHECRWHTNMVTGEYVGFDD